MTRPTPRPRDALLASLLLVAPAATAAQPAADAPDGATIHVPGVRLRDARLATGVRLRYAEQGDTAGRAVVLLHGYSDSWASFARVLPLLPPTLHVLALDQRGHGSSDRPALGYAMRDLAADVVALMDARGIERATIVGHSMGSLVAQQVALRAPERVERLVLIGAGTTARSIVGVDDLAAAVHAFETSDAPVPVGFAREFQESTVHAPVPSEFMDAMVASSLRLPTRVWQALLDGMLDTPVPAALAERRIPTLLLWGELDPYFPRAEQDALLRLVRPSTLTTYLETGHAPHWERPEAVARDLAAFVAAPR